MVGRDPGDFPRPTFIHTVNGRTGRTANMAEKPGLSIGRQMVRSIEAYTSFQLPQSLGQGFASRRKELGR